MSLTFNGLNGLTFGDGTSQNTAASGFAFKNRLINGDMRIDQRNVGTLITPTSGQYTTDRWQTATNVSGKFTVQQVADAPAGFTNSVKMTSTSAYNIGAGEVTGLRQYIEGYNAADFDWGLSSAKPVVLSFWAKSSLAGNFGGIIGNDSDRTYSFLYTINSANTWEYKTVIVTTGPTSGYRNTTTGVGMSVIFALSTGSSYVGVANQWNNSNVYGTSGQVQVLATNGATLQITGAQLEKGIIATSYDYRDWTSEMIMCKRYFQKSFAYDQIPTTSNSIGYLEIMGARHRVADVAGFRGAPYNFDVEMRAAPTFVMYNNAAQTTGTVRLLNYDGSTQDYGIGTWGGNSPTKLFYPVIYTGVAVGTAGYSISAGFNFTASAEL